MTAEFIVPGDIMRALQAELRYRGFDVEGAEAYPMDETGLIVGSALASKEDRQGWVVCVYGRETNVATVKSSTHGLDFTFEGEENTPMPDPPLELMIHPVTEAAHAIDDVEGFWTQGKDLDEDQLMMLNEAIRDREATVIRKGETHWLITLGRGFTYLVEPAERCASCGQTVFVDEVSFMAPGVHSACYDPREP